MTLKRVYLFWLCLSLVAGTALFASCSDDDNEGKLDPGSPEYITQSKTTEKALTLYQLLGTLAPTDSLPDNWETATYEPMLGDALDGATPYVRTLAVSGMDEAVAIYNAMTGRELKADAQSDTWSYEGLGSLSFQAAGTAELTATIQCALSQMPHLTTLRLVPASALGENADFEPYYHTGDVIQASDGSFWICARSANAAAGKKDSHWFSFQLDEKKNYKVYQPSETLEETTMPDDLGDNTTQMKYLMQLLSLMADPTIYADMIQHEMRNGLGDLGNAYKEADVKLMATGWDIHVWNRTTQKILPVGKNYFWGNGEITLLYKGHGSSFFSTTVSLYAAKYSGRGHSNATLYKDQWDMNKGRFFDVHNLVKTGRRCNNEVGPDKALVVRYKTASQLAGKSFLRLDPTLPIPGATDVFRLYKDNNDRKFHTGDFLTRTATGAKYFCVHPAAPDKGFDKALFVSFDEKELGVSSDRKHVENLMNQETALRTLYIITQLHKFTNKYQTTLDFIHGETGIAWDRLFRNREAKDGEQKFPCSSILYTNSTSAEKCMLRMVFCQENTGPEKGMDYTKFYTRYIPQKEGETTPVMKLEDVTSQDIITKYAKDKWSELDNLKAFIDNYMTKAVTSFDITDYIKSMKLTASTYYYNIFNEPVFIMRALSVSDTGTAPDGFTIIRNSDPYWSDANAGELVRLWAEECSTHTISLDDASYSLKK